MSNNAASPLPRCSPTSQIHYDPKGRPRVVRVSPGNTLRLARGTNGGSGGNNTGSTAGGSSSGNNVHLNPPVIIGSPGMSMPTTTTPVEKGYVNNMPAAIEDDFDFADYAPITNGKEFDDFQWDPPEHIFEKYRERSESSTEYKFCDGFLIPAQHLRDVLFVESKVKEENNLGMFQRAESGNSLGMLQLLQLEGHRHHVEVRMRENIDPFTFERSCYGKKSLDDEKNSPSGRKNSTLDEKNSPCGLDEKNSPSGKNTNLDEKNSQNSPSGKNTILDEKNSPSGKNTILDEKNSSSGKNTTLDEVDTEIRKVMEGSDTSDQNLDISDQNMDTSDQNMSGEFQNMDTSDQNMSGEDQNMDATMTGQSESGALKRKVGSSDGDPVIVSNDENNTAKSYALVPMDALLTFAGDNCGDVQAVKHFAIKKVIEAVKKAIRKEKVRQKGQISPSSKGGQGSPGNENAVSNGKGSQENTPNKYDMSPEKISPEKKRRKIQASITGRMEVFREMVGRAAKEIRSVSCGPIGFGNKILTGHTVGTRGIINRSPVNGSGMQHGTAITNKMMDRIGMAGCSPHSMSSSTAGDRFSNMSTRKGDMTNRHKDDLSNNRHNNGAMSNSMADDLPTSSKHRETGNLGNDEHISGTANIANNGITGTLTNGISGTNSGTTSNSFTTKNDTKYLRRKCDGTQRVNLGSLLAAANAEQNDPQTNNTSPQTDDTKFLEVLSHLEMVEGVENDDLKSENRNVKKTMLAKPEIGDASKTNQVASNNPFNKTTEDIDDLMDVDELTLKPINSENSGNSPGYNYDGANRAGSSENAAKDENARSSTNVAAKEGIISKQIRDSLNRSPAANEQQAIGSGSIDNGFAQDENENSGGISPDSSVGSCMSEVMKDIMTDLDGDELDLSGFFWQLSPEFISAFPEEIPSANLLYDPKNCVQDGFLVPARYCGLIVGTRGRMLEQFKAEAKPHNVEVKLFQKDITSQKIMDLYHFPKDSGFVRLTGQTAEGVQKIKARMSINTINAIKKILLKNVYKTRRDSSYYCCDSTLTPSQKSNNKNFHPSSSRSMAIANAEFLYNLGIDHGVDYSALFNGHTRLTSSNSQHTPKDCFSCVNAITGNGINNGIDNSAMINNHGNDSPENSGLTVNDTTKNTFRQPYTLMKGNFPGKGCFHGKGNNKCNAKGFGFPNYSIKGGNSYGGFDSYDSPISPIESAFNVGIQTAMKGMESVMRSTMGMGSAMKGFYYKGSTSNRSSSNRSSPYFGPSTTMASGEFNPSMAASLSGGGGIGGGIHSSSAGIKHPLVPHDECHHPFVMPSAVKGGASTLNLDAMVSPRVEREEPGLDITDEYDVFDENGIEMLPSEVEEREREKEKEREKERAAEAAKAIGVNKIPKKGSGVIPGSGLPPGHGISSRSSGNSVSSRISRSNISSNGSKKPNSFSNDIKNSNNMDFSNFNLAELAQHLANMPPILISNSTNMSSSPIMNNMSSPSSSMGSSSRSNGNRSTNGNTQSVGGLPRLAMQLANAQNNSDNNPSNHVNGHNDHGQSNGMMNGDNNHGQSNGIIDGGGGNGGNTNNVGNTNKDLVHQIANVLASGNNMSLISQLMAAAGSHHTSPDQNATPDQNKSPDLSQMAADGDVDPELANFVENLDAEASRFILQSLAASCDLRFSG